MSKKLKSFLPYETINDQGYDTFIRLSYDLLNSEAFKDLSNLAVLILIDSKNISGGKQEFTYSHGQYKKYCSSSGFQSAKKQLFEKGFWQQKNKSTNNRQDNRYYFSAKWKEYKSKRNEEII